MNKGLCALALSVLLLAGCSDRPKNILPEDKMVEVMADIQIAEAYDRSGEAPSEWQGMNREKLGRAVLKRHGVSEAEMDSTLAWYGRNMDEYAKLYKKIDERLSQMQRKYAKAAGESENAEGGADLWPYGHHLMVDENAFTDGIVLSIPAEELEPGDVIAWKMHARGASGSTVTLGVDYADGSAAIVKNRIYNSFDERIETELHTDTLLTATRIFASLKFDTSTPRVFIDSIQLTHRPRKAEEFDRMGFQRRVGAARRKTVLPPDSVKNSSLVADSIKESPSSSISKSLGESTRR